MSDETREEVGRELCRKMLDNPNLPAWLIQARLNPNEDFLKPKHLHECTRYSSKAVNVIWIESVEIIGGQVFLGLKQVYNWIDENNYEIGEVVWYENLLVFSRIQKIGVTQKLEEEIRARNEQNAAIMQELKEQKEKEQEQ